MNPRSNLKSEEKLDSLTGREGMSRLGRRESLIKSYRPVSRASPFLPLKSSRTANFRHEGAADFPPSYIIVRRPPHLFPCSFLLHRRSSIGAFLTTSVRSCRLISRSLLICFNYRTPELAVNHQLSRTIHRYVTCYVLFNAVAVSQPKI